MQHRGETLTAIEASQIRSLIERVGERQARAVLRVSGQTLARAVARMHLQRATVTHMRSLLSAVEGQSEPPSEDQLDSWDEVLP